MKLYQLVCSCCLFGCLMAACMKEDTPEATWKYEGPDPAIADGPSEAQKLCYALYQKYDFHVYYTLSGDDALRTGLGHAQYFKVQTYNSEAIPMKALDEDRAEKFLTLLTGFYALLPVDMVRSDMHKRKVLVRINPGNNRYYDEEWNKFYTNTNTEDWQGIIHYGFLDFEIDPEWPDFLPDEVLETNLKGVLRSVCYEFFRGLADTRYKGIPLPDRFVDVSKGCYYLDGGVSDPCIDLVSKRFTRAKGWRDGFVSVFGALAYTGDVLPDWGSYVAWVLTEPLTDRQAICEQYPKVKEKYDLVMAYYKKWWSIDLEKLSEQVQALTID